MLLTVLVLSIFGLAVLMVVGTALYGLVLAVGTGLASLFTDVRDRLLPRTTGDPRPGVTETPPHSVTSGEGLRAEAPEASTEVMWHRMQGHVKEVAPERDRRLTRAERPDGSRWHPARSKQLA